MKTKVLMVHDVRDHFKMQYKSRYEVPYFLKKKKFISKVNLVLKRYGNQPYDISSLSNSLKSLDYFFTFDDGLKDHLWVARKLSELGISAIFFIPSVIFDGRTFIDSHKIQFLLSVCGEDMVTNEILEKIDLQYKDIVFKNYSKSLWKDNIWNPKTIFCTRFFRSFSDYDLRRSLLNELFEKYVLKQDLSLHQNFYLSMEDLSEIKNLGHTIGSHGHESLNFEFEPESIIKKEIDMSNKFSIENSDYKLYAFANGGYNNLSLDYLKKLNFTHLFTTISKEWNKKDFLVPRIDFSKLDI